MNRKVQIEIADGPKVMCLLPEAMSLHNGDYCVIKYNGVSEYGHMVPAGEKNTGDKTGKSIGKVLRRATLQDQSKAAESALRGRMAFGTCEKKALELKLDISVIRVRYSLNRGVLFITFSADDKVDARDYINELSSELGCKIDVNQVGVRDKAGIIGGIGPCGRVLCCSSWLKGFSSINVKMAKRQGLSLSPSSIGGCCGRLKCCLKYEYSTYKQLDKFLPRHGVFVSCPEGAGKIVGKNILKQEVMIRLENGGVVKCPADEVQRKWQVNEVAKHEVGRSGHAVSEEKETGDTKA